LFGGPKSATLDILSDLAQKRYGMMLAFMQGLKTQRHFFEETGETTPERLVRKQKELTTNQGISVSQYIPVQQYLRKKSYIQAAQGARKAGHAASGKPQFVATKQTETMEDLLKDLFDPFLHIADYVSKAVLI